MGIEDRDAAARYKAEAERLSGARWVLDTTNEQLARLEGLLAASPLSNWSVA